MKRAKTFASANPVEIQTPVRPRLVKASELEARRAAAEAMQAQAPKLQAVPALRRAPRGEAEARQMFDMLFEAA